MGEYDQDRFELDIHAKEVQPPERVAMAKVFVSMRCLNLEKSRLGICGCGSVRIKY